MENLSTHGKLPKQPGDVILLPDPMNYDRTFEDALWQFTEFPEDGEPNLPRLRSDGNPAWRRSPLSRVLSDDEYFPGVTSPQSADKLTTCGSNGDPCTDPSDILIVSIDPQHAEYQFDAHDVEQVFSVIADVRDVRIIGVRQNRALVTVLAGQGVGVVALLDGHRLNGVSGCLRVTMLDERNLPMQQHVSSQIHSPNRSSHFTDWELSVRDSQFDYAALLLNTSNQENRFHRTAPRKIDGCHNRRIKGATPAGRQENNPFQRKKQLNTLNSAELSTSTPSSGVAVRKWTARYEVQVPIDNGFQVTRKIIGLRGCNMKSINQLTGAKLRLRGRGSGYLEGLDKKEAADPLHLCISCRDFAGYQLAREKVDSLLNGIYHEYDIWCRETRKLPSKLTIKAKEHLFSVSSKI